MSKQAAQQELISRFREMVAAPLGSEEREAKLKAIIRNDNEAMILLNVLKRAGWV